MEADEDKIVADTSKDSFSSSQDVISLNKSTFMSVNGYMRKMSALNMDLYEEVSYLSKLPDELIMKIVKNLNTTDITQLMQTCSRLLYICLDRSLWQTVDLRELEIQPECLAKLLSLMGSQTNKLYLSGNSTSDYIMDFDNFVRLKETCNNLTVLHITDQTIDASEVYITNFPKALRELSLARTNLVNSKYVQVFFYRIDTHLTELETLILSDCHWFVSHSMMVLSRLPKLKVFKLDGCFQLKECMPYVSLSVRYGYKSLEEIDLRRTFVSDSEVSCFNICKMLRCLYLEYQPNQQQECLHRQDQYQCCADPDSSDITNENFSDYDWMKLHAQLDTLLTTVPTPPNEVQPLVICKQLREEVAGLRHAVEQIEIYREKERRGRQPIDNLVIDVVMDELPVGSYLARKVARVKRCYANFLRVSNYNIRTENGQAGEYYFDPEKIADELKDIIPNLITPISEKQDSENLSVLFPIRRKGSDKSRIRSYNSIMYSSEILKMAVPGYDGDKSLKRVRSSSMDADTEEKKRRLDSENLPGPSGLEAENRSRNLTQFISNRPENLNNVLPQNVRFHRFPYSTTDEVRDQLQRLFPINPQVHDVIVIERGRRPVLLSEQSQIRAQHYDLNNVLSLQNFVRHNLLNDENGGPQPNARLSIQVNRYNNSERNEERSNNEPSSSTSQNGTRPSCSVPNTEPPKQNNKDKSKTTIQISHSLGVTPSTTSKDQNVQISEEAGPSNERRTYSINVRNNTSETVPGNKRVRLCNEDGNISIHIANKRIKKSSSRQSDQGDDCQPSTSEVTVDKSDLTDCETVEETPNETVDNLSGNGESSKEDCNDENNKAEDSCTDNKILNKINIDSDISDSDIDEGKKLNGSSVKNEDSSVAGSSSEIKTKPSSINLNNGEQIANERAPQRENNEEREPDYRQPRIRVEINRIRIPNRVGEMLPGLVSDRTISALFHLRSECRRLQRLSLRGYPDVTDGGLLLVAASQHPLQWLDVRGTHVSASACARFRILRPDCTLMCDYPSQNSGILSDDEDNGI